MANTFHYEASSLSVFCCCCHFAIDTYIYHSSAVHPGYDFCVRRWVSIVRNSTDTLSYDLLNFNHQNTLHATYPTHLILVHLTTQIIMVNNTNSDIARRAVLPLSAPLPLLLMSLRGTDQVSLALSC